ncbi:hypothetical protein [Enhygromyxa salina]|uniref:Uncharacterized protein n=1 Tax=Enhygromyxa salina TaxID=215803 RepID=A0A2S9YJJ5_9BACT|nr:hypothetical protein [Enhygromyxa salina]PRQ05251.1 hypothetical protein ENSA7_47010 [Enhygromyxa salina]
MLSHQRPISTLARGLARAACLLFVLVLGCSSGVGTEAESGSFGSSATLGTAGATDSDSESDGGDTSGPFCGDQVCDPLTESCQTCQADCDVCPYCGDGTCNGSEDCMQCAQDCEVCPGCGDDICDPQETCATCPQDCTNGCGESICGDMICNGADTCQNCEQDCGMCAPACGDGMCNGAENCGSCEQDCGACANCPNNSCGDDESCISCPADCGACTCPCVNNNPEFNNFCHHGPNTAGCPMTQPGGYCDPNGDGSYQDADWNLGFFDYAAQCN